MTTTSSISKKHSLVMLATGLTTMLLLSGCGADTSRFKNINEYLDLVDYETAGDAKLLEKTESSSSEASTYMRYSITGEKAYQLLDERTQKLEGVTCEEKDIAKYLTLNCTTGELKISISQQKDVPAELILTVFDSKSGTTEIF